MTIRKVAVFCASSRQVDAAYFAQAREMGRLFAETGVEIVYGGGGTGLMGQLADGALDAGGRVVGVIPDFMVEREWAYERATEMIIVPDMADRKRRMVEGVDGVVALPGGSGTLDELIEVITLKRLGKFTRPIVMVSVNGFFDPLEEMLRRCVEQRFMDPRSLQMWSVVGSSAEVIGALEGAESWGEDAIDFAAV